MIFLFPRLFRNFIRFFLNFSHLRMALKFRFFVSLNFYSFFDSCLFHNLVQYHPVFFIIFLFIISNQGYWITYLNQYVTADCSVPFLAITILHAFSKTATSLFSFHYFFISRFSFKDTDSSQDCRGRKETIFIPLYPFHPLTNIQKFICNFACEMTTTYFKSHCM